MLSFLSFPRGNRRPVPCPDLGIRLALPRGARASRLVMKIFLFVATFLLAWLLNSRTAASPLPEAAPGGGPKEAPAARGPKEKEPQSPIAPPVAPEAAPAKVPWEKLLYKDIAWAIATEWSSRSDPSGDAERLDGEALRARLYDMVIGIAAAGRSTEDPRRRMESACQELFGRRGFRILPRPEGGYGPEHILIDEVVRRKAGSPLAVAVVYLAALELLTPSLELKAVILPGAASARLQDGNSAAVVLFSPGDSGRLVRDDAIRARLANGSATRTEAIRALSKAELAGALFLELARAARSREDPETALRLLGRAVDLHPWRVAAWHELAELADRIGDRTREKAALAGALLADPQDAWALSRRARIARSEGGLDLAERDLLNALSNLPRPEPDVLLALADVQKELGHPDEALASYRRALVMDPPEDVRARILEQIRDLEIRPALEILAGSTGYPARFEALRKVAAARTPASTEALIPILRDENQRFARLAWRFLKTSTGQDMGFDAEAWERWWAARNTH